MNIRTKENNKYVTLYIPSFEVFYKVIQRITNELNNKDFESFKRYNFNSDIVKLRFQTFYNEHLDETVSLRKIKYNCNVKNFNVLSKDFYLERGWDEDYSNKMISETQKIRSMMSAKKMTSDRTQTQIGYWIKKGLTEEQAKQKLHERQCTFSKNKCIEKYGFKKGLIIFEERQKKWQDTIYEKFSLEEISSWKQNNKFASKAACDLFLPFYNQLKSKYKCYMFNENSNVKEYFIWDNEAHKVYCYDFAIIELGLIFEYNGEHVHPNPNMPKEDWDNWKQCYTGKSADTVYEEYQRKIKLAEQQGFKVIQLWHKTDINVLKNIISSEIQASEQALLQLYSLHEGE